jgi:hypothetical protein
MRTVRWDEGSTRWQTMTVGELKTALNNLPDDLPVFYTWENYVVPGEPDGFTVEEWGIDKTKCLFINAE